jgi:hypothetical protein
MIVMLFTTVMVEEEREIHSLLPSLSLSFFLHSLSFAEYSTKKKHRILYGYIHDEIKDAVCCGCVFVVDLKL